MVTHVVSTEMKFGNYPWRIWIPDVGEAGWDIYIILLVWWRMRRILWA